MRLWPKPKIVAQRSGQAAGRAVRKEGLSLHRAQLCEDREIKASIQQSLYARALVPQDL